MTSSRRKPVAERPPPPTTSADPRKGPPPRVGTPRTPARATYGPAVAEVAAHLGTPFMPWQQHVADVGLELEDGHLVYRDISVAVPRQSGKSTLLLALIIHRMLSSPGVRVAYGAQSRLAARGKLFDTLWPALRRSQLGGLFKLTRATGAESLRCTNGGILTLLSSEEAAGHGETLSLVVLDEAWSLTAATEQAVRPAMATRLSGQLWAFSTAGTDRSAWWRQRIEAGRLAATSGLDSGAAYLEWSPADGVDVGDPATWHEFMPALGHLIDESVVAADMAIMSPSEWQRAYCCMWPDESELGWSTIDRDAWEAAQLR